jgi:excisionase family DNA binding protein
MPGRKPQPQEPLKPVEAADHERDDSQRALETERTIRAAERGVTRRTYTVDEVGTILGISRAAAFNFVRDGTIPSIRLGRRLLIPAPAIERLLGAST